MDCEPAGLAFMDPLLPCSPASSRRRFIEAFLLHDPSGGNPSISVRRAGHVGEMSVAWQGYANDAFSDDRGDNVVPGDGNAGVMRRVVKGVPDM